MEMLSNSARAQNKFRLVSKKIMGENTEIPDIGPVGTVPPQNNFALEAFYTMKKHTPATGHRMLADVRNIVSHLIKVGVG